METFQLINNILPPASCSSILLNADGALASHSSPTIEYFIQMQWKYCDCTLSLPPTLKHHPRGASLAECSKQMASLEDGQAASQTDGAVKWTDNEPSDQSRG